MQHTIESFVDRLVMEKGITGVSNEVLDQMKQDLIDRAENLINAEILSHMPQFALNDFEKLLATGSDDEVQAFCKEKIPNLDEVIAATLLRFRDMYLQTTIA